MNSSIESLTSSSDELPVRSSDGKGSGSCSSCESCESSVSAELIEGNGYEGRQTSKGLNNRRSYNLKVPIT